MESFMCWSADKVGIFPLAVAACFSWQKLRADQSLVFSGLPGVEWAVVATLVFVYLLSFSQYSTCLPTRSLLSGAQTCSGEEEAGAACTQCRYVNSVNSVSPSLT